MITARYPEVARALRALPVSPLRARRRDRRARRGRAGRASSGCSRACTSRAPRDIERRPRRGAGRSACSSTASLSTVAICGGCRSSSARQCLALLVPAARRGPLRRSRRGRRRGLLRGGCRAAGLEGIVAKRATSAYTGGAHARLAQDQVPAAPGVRHRRLHRSPGLARPLRRAAPRRLRGGDRARLRVQGGHRLRRAPRSPAIAERLAPARPRRPRRSTAGTPDRPRAPLGRAATRLRGALHRVDGRRRHPPPDLPRAPRRQDGPRSAGARRPVGAAARPRPRRKSPAKRDSGPARAAETRRDGDDHQSEEGVLAERGLHQGRSRRVLRDAWRRTLLPYLRDRPLVLTRYPDGITGKSFFQKDAPEFAPEWIRTERIYSHDTERDIDYFVVDDVETLRYVANLGTIPLHFWGSRVPHLERPDWLVLDLDPKGAPVHRRGGGRPRPPAHPRRARAAELREDLGRHRPAHPGAARRPLHLRARRRTFARLLATLGVEAAPEIATIARPLRARGGKVYIDFGQNGHGHTIVAPYSVRPLPGAPVSCPLRWDEVTPQARSRALHDHHRARPLRRDGGSADPVLAAASTCRPGHRPRGRRSRALRSGAEARLAVEQLAGSFRASGGPVAPSSCLK